MRRDVSYQYSSFFVLTFNTIFVSSCTSSLTIFTFESSPMVQMKFALRLVKYQSKLNKFNETIVRLKACQPLVDEIEILDGRFTCTIVRDMLYRETLKTNHTGFSFLTLCRYCKFLCLLWIKMERAFLSKTMY